MMVVVVVGCKVVTFVVEFFIFNFLKVFWLWGLILGWVVTWF